MGAEQRGDWAAPGRGGGSRIVAGCSPPPVRPGPTTGDAGTGVQMALAITAAYAQKLRTGKGQHIELSMQEAMTYYLLNGHGKHAVRERGRPERIGNGGPSDDVPLQVPGATVRTTTCS